MNKNQIKGKAKDIGGKIQEEVGDMVDSSKQQAEGLRKQVEGKTQKKLGDVEEKLDERIDRGNRQ
jgi:uncharacterized protein YjbJ (UPF0337 family)